MAKQTLAEKQIELAGRTAQDPLGFVQVGFPWGKPGDLANETGPDVWQADILNAVGKGILSLNEAVRIAVASGHGVGKSATVSWLILWALTTKPDTRGIITANTESQLRTKTWAELAKWHRLSFWSDWFEFTATAVFSTVPGHDKTWRIDAVPWSETRTEAFAGLHNAGKRILVLFDEASAIPDKIWETTEGALTDPDTEIIWAVFGNPTRNTGRFRECFGQFRHRWITKQIDSRLTARANKRQAQEWVDDYGEDSDFVRVRVRGVFPRAGDMQFIPTDLIEAAAGKLRDVPVGVWDPLVMGVDVARFGGDATVIRFRRGRDARSIEPIKMRGENTMTVAARIAEEYFARKPDAVFIDEGGVGGGVIDRCHQLKIPVMGIQFGGRADKASPAGSEPGILYANKRAEMWGSMREWLKGGMIDPDPELIQDLQGVQYGYALKDGRDAILLEKKEDMKKRGLASSDNGDALALTFAYPVAPSDHRQQLSGRATHQVEHNPFGSMWKGNAA